MTQAVTRTVASSKTNSNTSPAPSSGTCKEIKFPNPFCVPKCVPVPTSSTGVSQIHGELGAAAARAGRHPWSWVVAVKASCSIAVLFSPSGWWFGSHTDISLQGLSAVIAAAQGLGPWLMCSHVGSWQLVLVCPRCDCVAIAVRAVVMWLCCAPFTGRHLHCLTPPDISAKQSCVWERLPYAGLGKNGKAKRLVPLVQSGLKAQKHTDTTVVSHPFANMRGNLCKPYRHSCGNNICSYR